MTRTETLPPIGLTAPQVAAGKNESSLIAPPAGYEGIPLLIVSHRIAQWVYAPLN